MFEVIKQEERVTKNEDKQVAEDDIIKILFLC